jgi:phenylpropionate dioxygenase-like ring-hydroxylating dioxygenase large terminal subunit
MNDVSPAIDAGAPDTLPAWTYFNAEFTELELEHIFYPTWMVVCHVSEVARPGQYVTFDLGRERCFVTRDSAGTLNAFHNVCRHRAHPLVERSQGACRGGLLRCPYHGWTYGLDGDLRIIPDEETFPAIDKTRFGLKPVEMATFQGFVFVRFRPGGPSLEDWLGIDPDDVAPYRFEDVKPCRPLWSQVLECDWKNTMDNYQESYHVPIGHPGLHDLVGRNETGYLTLRDKRSKRWSVGLYQSLLPDFPHLPDHLQRVWRYFTVLPNMAFDVYPDMMDFFQVLPAGPGRCVIRSGAYALPDKRRVVRAVRWLNERVNGQVQAEDNALTVAVQRGLMSSSYAGGYLSTKERWLKRFQDLVRERLPVANLGQAPEPGTVAARNRDLL